MSKDPREPRRTAPVWAAVAVIALSLLSCKDPTQKQSSEIGTPPPPTQVLDTAKVFSSLRVLEDAVMRSPKDTSLSRRLLIASFDSTSGCFFTVGKGMPNPALPAAAQRPQRERAATLDANRWALYLMAWYSNMSIPFGSPIAGEITWSEVVREEMDGDTLYRMVKVPVGSVVFKK